MTDTAKDKAGKEGAPANGRSAKLLQLKRNDNGHLAGETFTTAEARTLGINPEALQEFDAEA